MFNHCPHCGGFSLLFYTVIQRRMFHMGYHHPFDSETFAFSQQSKPFVGVQVSGPQRQLITGCGLQHPDGLRRQFPVRSRGRQKMRRHL